MPHAPEDNINVVLCWQWERELDRRSAARKARRDKRMARNEVHLARAESKVRAA